MYGRLKYFQTVALFCKILILELQHHLKKSPLKQFKNNLCSVFGDHLKRKFPAAKGLEYLLTQSTASLHWPHINQ